MIIMALWEDFAPFKARFGIIIPLQTQVTRPEWEINLSHNLSLSLSMSFSLCLALSLLLPAFPHSFTLLVRVFIVELSPYPVSFPPLTFYQSSHFFHPSFSVLLSSQFPQDKCPWSCQLCHMSCHVLVGLCCYSQEMKDTSLSAELRWRVALIPPAQREDLLSQVLSCRAFLHLGARLNTAANTTCMDTSPSPEKRSNDTNVGKIKAVHFYCKEHQLRSVGEDCVFWGGLVSQFFPFFFLSSSVVLRIRF